MLRQATAVRRATNVTLSEPLLREARALRVNVSQACEGGPSAAVSEARSLLWVQENRAAMEAWNAYVEQHGLPLAGFRQF